MSFPSSPPSVFSNLLFSFCPPFFLFHSLFSTLFPSPALWLFQNEMMGEYGHAAGICSGDRRCLGVLVPPIYFVIFSVTDFVQSGYLAVGYYPTVFLIYLNTCLNPFICHVKLQICQRTSAPLHLGHLAYRPTPKPILNPNPTLLILTLTIRI